MPEDKLPHIVLPSDFKEEKKFTSPQSGGGKVNIPPRVRQSHAQSTKQKLIQAWEESESEYVATHSDRHGVYLEFKGELGYELAVMSLESQRGKDKSKWIRLLNVRAVKHKYFDEITSKELEKETKLATVFVPNEKKKYFLNKIEKYANENSKLKDGTPGKPKNTTLIDSISDIKRAMLKSFWLDDPALIPSDTPEWCEVWLRSDKDKEEEVIQHFETLLVEQQITYKDGVIKFPERAVKLVCANRAQLEKLIQHSDYIAEYRKAKETAAFWAELPPRDQAEWAEDLLKRLRINKDSQVSICILDTGVNNGHPLISQMLNSDDCQSVYSNWGTHDHDGHGTLMAGISCYGSLVGSLSNSGAIDVNHILESVKILPPIGENDPELWGDVTSQGISRAEIQAPERKRISCMAVNATDTRDRGRPTSWSGALDQLVSNAAEGENASRRMIIVSAGNITDFNKADNYHHAQLTDSIHDPAQSWNALTVGGYTELCNITDQTLSGYTPIAPKGGLSPFTTTSLEWDNKWPIKPEVVMESGNLAKDGAGFTTESADLSLLSTYYKPQERLFEFFNMTSASTAQASWFAAQIQSLYPNYWPETVRALMVHSAEWTETLKSQFLDNGSKTEMGKLLRICGYGVPNFEKALYCASNSLTLISQAFIQPFMRKDGRNKTNDMHLYDLPWPKDVLLGLASNTEVQMRITLSYFIEPGPGEIGWKDRYRYASHALRFDIKSPTETKDQFLKRINNAALDEDEERPKTESAANKWLLGANARDKGSIHSDIWKGTAAELADSNIVAVYPVVGWWRERHHLGKCEKQTRYSLIVSISTPEESIDIYTPVAIQVGLTVPITV